jgi:NUDIX domain.
MSGVKFRRRGTAIVETERGILLTAGRTGKPFILPGGGTKRGESRFMAALRELTEETHLLPYSAQIIFKHKGKVRPTMRQTQISRLSYCMFGQGIRYSKTWGRRC